jgi:hypothetical protein
MLTHPNHTRKKAPAMPQSQPKPKAHDAHLANVLETSIETDFEIPTQGRRSPNIMTCVACGDPVALMSRKGIKLAWTEETLLIRGTEKTLYFCQPCAETGSIEKQTYLKTPRRRPLPDYGVAS